MEHECCARRIDIESGFDSFDGTRLFYRAWLPATARADGNLRAFVFLHRGHEHSGRIQPLISEFVEEGEWAFAWDARGHGYSPGARGDAPDFCTLVRDFNAFIHHLIAKYGIAMENFFIVANSVGAIIAATWLHDYAPRVRGAVMAAAAFDINLYIPFAKPALRLATRFKPDLCVTSYIRSSMLTHSQEQAAAYDNDPLITKNISARVLLDLADTAQRIVNDAAAIDVPILMLVADRDYVVKRKPQWDFFERLSSPLKRYVVLEGCHHAVFYEQDTTLAFQASGEFIEACYAQQPPEPRHYHDYDSNSASASRYAALIDRRGIGWAARIFYGIQRGMLRVLGPLSNGMRIGLANGFDSGASLDYVYTNRANGSFGIGKFIDRNYLDAIGWRGVRLRKVHLQKALSDLIARQPTDRPMRILDIAAGAGRYVLETVKRFQDRNIEVTLRDHDEGNLEQARRLATQLKLSARVTYQRRDAFDPASYLDDEEAYDIVIISGLYELFADNALVLQSLQGVGRKLRAWGHLIYTGQPWHPQLDLIACTLNDHRQGMWTMRPRPQCELDALVASAGCRKISTEIGLAGIFTVSVAQKIAAHGESD
jgi:alpha-beta hydrolase superfamily lysophospholipase/SAM-dependent methyltransferase